MPLILLSVSPFDIQALASIHYTSTLSNPLTQLLYGDADPLEIQASMNRGMAMRVKDSIEDPQNPHRYMKVVDTDLGNDGEGEGEMISYADWVVPVGEDDEKEKAGKGEGEGEKKDGKESKREEEEEVGGEKAPPRPSFPKGMNIAVQEAFMKEITALRERVLGKRKHYLLGNLATVPTHQGRGAASQLIKWPFEDADKAGVMIYLDTDLEGKGINLYKKLGFKVVDECRLDLGKLGSEGVHTHVGMVREPGTPY